MNRRPQPVAWGKRRHDYQLGSRTDQRETYRRLAHARALAQAPIVHHLERKP